jgi:hypothetical protein
MDSTKAIAQEIASALRLLHRPGRAIPFWEAVPLLAAQLGTKEPNLVSWIIEATEDPGHPFEMVGTYGGRIFHVSRGSEISILLDEAGYGEKDQQTWPILSADGEYVRDLSEDADGEEFLILSDDLREMCQRHQSFVARHRAAIEHGRRLQAEGIERAHGQDLPYLRGLMKTAGIDPAELRTDFNLDTAEISLTLILDSAGITKVAEVLAAFGIEPHPPAEVRTRKPLPEASDA